MKALKLFGKNDIRLVEAEVPRIGEGELLLKTSAAAVCGTDIRMWKNGHSGVDSEHPLILGHEFSGTIVETGSGVSCYKTGMKVAMQPNIGCGVCDRCVSGKFHLCDSYKAFGINMDGAFAEYVRIPAEAVNRGNLMVLPESVDPVVAAVVEPLSCAYNGFSKCFVKPGEKAMVVGAGPIGMCHAMLLHMAGAKVLVNDIQKERLLDCRQRFPFIEIYGGNDLEGYIQTWTEGAGLDIAIVACPVPAVQASVLKLMNYGGRINFFGGIPKEQEPVPIDTNYIHYKELYLTGSTRSSIAQFRKTMHFVRAGLLPVERLVTHRYSLERGTEAFENAGNAIGIKHIFVF